MAPALRAWLISGNYYALRKNQVQAREIRRLERDLQKKEKALAKAAELPLIEKRLDAIWPQVEES